MTDYEKQELGKIEWKIRLLIFIGIALILFMVFFKPKPVEKEVENKEKEIEAITDTIKKKVNEVSKEAKERTETAKKRTERGNTTKYVPTISEIDSITTLRYKYLIGETK